VLTVGYDSDLCHSSLLPQTPATGFVPQPAPVSRDLATILQGPSVDPQWVSALSLPAVHPESNASRRLQCIMQACRLFRRNRSTLCCSTVTGGGLKPCKVQAALLCLSHTPVIPSCLSHMIRRGAVTPAALCPSHTSVCRAAAVVQQPLLQPIHLAFSRPLAALKQWIASSRSDTECQQNHVWTWHPHVVLTDRDLASV